MISALLQLVQTRMMLPAADGDKADDPNTDPAPDDADLPAHLARLRRFLPAGLFIYWIVSTVFSIVQQYLIVGWGGMFPLFGWTPGFARDHTPRFPVALPPPVDPTKRPPKSAARRSRPRTGPLSADKTIRPRERGRQGRRGRRR